MATTLTLATHSKVEQHRANSSEPAFGAALVTALTAIALFVHGYHPFAEDGGIYLAGVKRLLNPALYPLWSEFVTEHLRFSLFAPFVAGLVHASHLSLMAIWLLLYIASFWMTLFAAWLLATRCYLSREARCGAVALLATWLTMPIAGTSLMLMDPYLSARSLSTPLSLLALVGAPDLKLDGQTSRAKSLDLCSGSLLLAALIHPLMAAYALGCVLLLLCLLSKSSKTKIIGTALLSSGAVFAAAILYRSAPPETTAYLQVALTRTYWFIARWRWYEQLGLFAPIAILATVALQRGRSRSAASRGLAGSSAIAAVVAVIVAALFARTQSATDVIARLQPLRIFQIIYILMILSIGAFLGERLLQRRASRWLLTFTILVTVMFSAERYTFPGSARLELPWSQPENAWERAFEWIRVSTPIDALFALDAHYVTLPGEDAQTFRAIAERSALADYSKDGGEASITPALTALWFIGQTAQTDLNSATDAQRIARLKPLGVSWVVLPARTATHLACSYSNETVKVCHLSTH